MRHPVDPTVLRRKIAAHARPQEGGLDLRPAASRGLSRALRRAATPFEGLDLVPGQVAVTADVDLDGATAALPDHGLCAALEDDAGRRGLLAMAPGMIDALVEVQTTGRVEPTPLPARTVTRIDEALARDFVDLMLAAFAQETGGVAGRNWPERMAYGSRVRDRGQISLLLPEGPYMVLSAEVGLGVVDRRARMVLVLPRVAPVAAAGAGAGGPAKALDPRWVAARARLVDMLHLPLDVVLMRTRRPLGEVEALGVGDLLHFAAADLQKVSLETDDGRTLVQGRLGQIGGRRAFRLAPPAGSAGGQFQRGAGAEFGHVAATGFGSGAGSDMARGLDLRTGSDVGAEAALGMEMGMGAGHDLALGEAGRPGMMAELGTPAGHAPGFGAARAGGLEVGADGWPMVDPLDSSGTHG